MTGWCRCPIFGGIVPVPDTIMKISSAHLILACLPFGLGAAPSDMRLPVVDLDALPVDGAESRYFERPEGIPVFIEEAVFETGRSLAYIDNERLAGRNIDSMEGLAGALPGAYAPARFGVVTVPNVRGDAAETLLNGQRRGDNLFGFRPNFTTLQSAELLMGPGSVRHGPGKRTGGLLNLVTHRASPATDFGTAGVRVGTWVIEGGSYPMVSGWIDINQSLGKDQAVRVILSARDDKTYYEANGGKDDMSEVYLAYHYERPDSFSWDFITIWNWHSSPQTLGVNRPWQGLIDSGLYLTGEVDPQLGGGDPPGPLDPGLADPGLLASDPGDAVRLDQDRVLMSEGDYAEGSSVLAQSILARSLAADSAIVQQTLVEYVDRSKLNQFYYAEDVQQFTADAQLRWLGQGEWDQLDWRQEAGLSGRYEERENLTNYWNEFAYAFDITDGRRFNAYERFPANIAPGAVITPDGRPWYLPGTAVFATPESTVSQLGQAGIYWKGSLTTLGGWMLEVGLRLDGWRVRAEEALDPVDREPLEDELGLFRASGHLSLSRTWETTHAYVTAGRFSGVAGNTVGDGVNLYVPDGIRREDLSNEVNLLEGGLRWAPITGIDMSFSLFHQERTRREFFGPNDIRVRGAEWRVGLQVPDRFGLIVDGTYLDAHYINASPAEFGGGSLGNVYAVGTGPDGLGNGLGYIGGFFLNSLPPANYQIPGVSDWQLRTELWARIADGVRVRTWLAWQGVQNGNLAAEYVIPSQVTLNASLQWRVGDWELQLTGYNLTNEENWIHNGDTFFNQMLVSRALPARVEGSLQYRF